MDQLCSASGDADALLEGDGDALLEMVVLLCQK